MFHYFMSVLFCLVQDWKVGDRVLAKWQDGKFYPGKIVKPPHDGKIILCTQFELVGHVSIGADFQLSNLPREQWCMVLGCGF